MGIDIRLACLDDLTRIMDIYAMARDFMAASGNPQQWGDDGYPSKTLITEDIAQKQLYVVVSDHVIEGVFMHAVGHDPTYTVIDGAWLNDHPYGVIHRIASAGHIKGILRTAVAFALTRCPQLRIDTHDDNLVMQQALQRLGFVYCGIIHIDTGAPRRAYHLASTTNL